MIEDGKCNRFHWCDFLDLAKMLAQREDEASHRTAISRSYYAVFHVAREVLEHLEPDQSGHKSSDSHKVMWDRFGTLRQRQAQSAKRRGRSLLAERTAADYRLAGSDWSKRANDAVERAQAVINGLVDLLPDK